jgi:deazaflavin-dependent oxidoreductase (nitroreductase family)
VAEDSLKLQVLLGLTRAVNPLVSWLLRSRLHATVSENITLLHFQGRRSGRWYSTPVTYIEDGGALRICTSSPWWKNIRDRPNVRLHLRGREISARARTTSDGGEHVVETIRDLLTRIPRDAPFYKVRMGNDGRPNMDDVRRAAAETIVIDVELPRP